MNKIKTITLQIKQIAESEITDILDDVFRVVQLKAGEHIKMMSGNQFEG